MTEKLGNILVCDDDQSTLELLSAILAKNYKVFRCQNHSDFFEIISNETIDLVFLDILLGNDNGFEILRQLKEQMPEIEVIVMSILKNAETVVKAIKLGAFDYLPKDFNADDVLLKACSALKLRTARKRISVFNAERKANWESSFVPVNELEIYPSFKNFVRCFRRNNFTILSGEAGTGKKTFFRALELKEDNEGPFIVFSTSLLTPDSLMKELFFSSEKSLSPDHSLIELANNGVLCIDRLEKTPRNFQERLFGLIKSGSFYKNGRLVPLKLKLVAAVSSTMKNIDVVSGLIPEFINLAENNIVQVPPLRERKRDIVRFSNHYADYFCRSYDKDAIKISEPALKVLKKHSWTFNILELKNVMESAVLTDDDHILDTEDLPLKHFVNFPSNITSISDGHINLKDKIDGFERDTLIKILKHFRWNKKRASDFLAIPYSTMKLKIRKYRIMEPPPQRPRGTVFKT
jgi:DNA-binding NtrC family response regulator